MFHTPIQARQFFEDRVIQQADVVSYAPRCVSREAIALATTWMAPHVWLAQAVELPQRWRRRQECRN